MKGKRRPLYVEVDTTSIELECALDNLLDVHAAMEADGSANWQKHCNAVFACYLMLRAIHKQLDELTDQEMNYQSTKMVILGLNSE